MHLPASSSAPAAEWQSWLGFLAIVVYYRIHNHNRCPPSTDTDTATTTTHKSFSSDTNTNPSSASDPLITITPSSKPFPWEPKIKYDSGAKRESDRYSSISIASKHHTKETSPQQQLDFLQSMTFAQTGGLRPPSCPCCF